MQVKSKKVLVSFASIKTGKEFLMGNNLMVKVRDKVAMDRRGNVYNIPNNTLVSKVK